MTRFSGSGQSVLDRNFDAYFRNPYSQYIMPSENEQKGPETEQAGTVFSKLHLCSAQMNPPLADESPESHERFDR